MKNPLGIAFHPSQLFKIMFLVFVSLALTSTSLRLTNAQTGPETVWEDGREVMVLEKELTSVSIQAAPTAPGTHYRTYSGTAFQPNSSSMTFNPFGAAIYVTVLPPGGYSLNVEMLLPQGATITEVVFYVQDNDAANFDFQLKSYAPDTNSFLALEYRTSTGTSTATQTIIMTVDPPVIVDNTIKSYRLRVAPGVATSNHLLYGARVGFTVPTNYLPLIER